MPINDRVKLTFSDTLTIAGKTSMRRHSWASGHLLMICASSGTGAFAAVRRVEVYGMPPSLDVDGRSDRTVVIGDHER